METRYSRSPLLDITSALEYVGQSAFGQLQFFLIGPVAVMRRTI